ncbi:hypothetical protein FRB96_007675 [Tulasnella sp. 330]|nr:hypothetical protein FRB96_007675 [Tulasnella sp. 330]KAG8889627.1 hypothetical protein FRB98_003430 [Tulasnella sp. 332]
MARMAMSDNHPHYHHPHLLREELMLSEEETPVTPHWLLYQPREQNPTPTVYDDWDFVPHTTQKNPRRIRFPDASPTGPNFNSMDDQDDSLQYRMDTTDDGIPHSSDVLTDAHATAGITNGAFL